RILRPNVVAKVLVLAATALASSSGLVSTWQSSISRSFSNARMLKRFMPATASWCQGRRAQATAPRQARHRSNACLLIVRIAEPRGGLTSRHAGFAGLADRVTAEVTAQSG